jgi:putative flippase GtrA
MIGSAGPLAAIARPIYLRYAAASVGALAVDVGLFLVALAAGIPAVLASAIGYGAGIAAHWLLSSRTVFQSGVARPGAARRRQQALFLLSAFAGLAITISVVALGGWAGIDPRIGKVVAIGLAFQLTYMLRRRFVFA